MMTDLNPVQPQKANPSTEVTELGMVIFVKPLQPKNAQLPIFVTLEPIVIDVIAEQSWKANSPISVTLYVVPVLEFVAVAGKIQLPDGPSNRRADHPGRGAARDDELKIIEGEIIHIGSTGADSHGEAHQQDRHPQ